MEEIKFRVGYKYEGKDIHGDWRLITLTSDNSDGTFQAVVHDGFNSLWCNVHKTNLRRQHVTHGLLPLPKSTEYGVKAESGSRFSRDRFLRTPSTSPDSCRGGRENYGNYRSPSPYFGYQYNTRGYNPTSDKNFPSVADPMGSSQQEPCPQNVNYPYPQPYFIAATQPQFTTYGQTPASSHTTPFAVAPGFIPQPAAASPAPSAAPQLNDMQEQKENPDQHSSAQLQDFEVQQLRQQIYNTYLAQQTVVLPMAYPMIYAAPQYLQYQATANVGGVPQSPQYQSPTNLSTPFPAQTPYGLKQRPMEHVKQQQEIMPVLPDHEFSQEQQEVPTTGHYAQEKLQLGSSDNSAQAENDACATNSFDEEPEPEGYTTEPPSPRYVPSSQQLFPMSPVAYMNVPTSPMHPRGYPIVQQNLISPTHYSKQGQQQVYPNSYLPSLDNVRQHVRETPSPDIYASQSSHTQHPAENKGYGAVEPVAAASQPGRNGKRVVKKSHEHSDATAPLYKGDAGPNVEMMNIYDYWHETEKEAVSATKQLARSTEKAPYGKRGRKAQNAVDGKKVETEKWQVKQPLKANPKTAFGPQHKGPLSQVCFEGFDVACNPSPKSTPRTGWTKIWRRVDPKEDVPSTTVTSTEGEDDADARSKEDGSRRHVQHRPRTSQGFRHPLVETYRKDPKNVIIAWQQLQPKDRKKSLEQLVECVANAGDADGGLSVVAVFSAILKHGVKKQWLKHLNRMVNNVEEPNRKAVWGRLSRMLEDF
eukprot:GEMP01003989.1.p1 GENE.GEMP01003989.1~~GEMP01003989.1.p1  ORF type:complete len:756 (+),score=141.35 GEMP01003989.1:53-2320(+)